MRLHEAYNAEDAADLIGAMKDLEGPLLPILHSIQSRYGHVPEAAIRLVSAELNLSRAEVYGVVSFYHDYRQEPHGRRVLKVCRAEACQARGSDAVADAVETALDTKFGETSPDGQVTLEAVYCLGLCAVGPNAMLDGRLFARLDPAKAERLTQEARL